MAAIRMLFSWLTEKGVLAMNPAREVKTERFSRAEGKTPAFVEGEVQKLLGVIETSTHTGLRDRAREREIPGGQVPDSACGVG
jgi:integrase/recombinase XerC